VIIASHCESEGDKAGSCRAQVDITEQLNRLPDTQWQNLSIDLNCFAKQGLKYSQVIMPFAISTSGKANLSISDIHFAPEQSESASIQCE
jgi:beta-glucosidase